MAANIDSISPNGCTSRLVEELKITHATPINAIDEPIYIPRPGFSLAKNMPVSMAVNIGDRDVRSDTLEARVYSSAVFSAIKYSELPHSAHSINNTSSRQEWDLNRL